MRVSWEWLNELADLEGITPAEGAHMLTMVAFVVESIEQTTFEGIVVGRVLSQEPHPKSRNPLWVHQVDVGGQTRQIIAGAPNAVPGALVPVALPGTTVPSGRYVRDAVIAGIAGQGMLCSIDELKLGESTEPAILILDRGEPGQPLAALFGDDAVLEVEITPNRPDCLGHLGVARELAAAAGRRLKVDFLPPFIGEEEPPATDLVGVTIEAEDLCRRFLGAVIEDVTVAPSPEWMQRRLRASGVRPINNLVDITQYVMLEYGQPLHVYDLDKLAGPEIRVRRARAGESMLFLDGQTRVLGEHMLVIADRDRAVGLAGVMGGQETAVESSTRRVLLEAANFDGVNIRATSRAVRLRTDASARFEKKLSPELALAGARRAAHLIRDLAGGRVHRGWPDVYPRPQEPVRVSVDPLKLDALLGAHVPIEESQAILRRLDFQVRAAEDGTWDVLPPVFRLDVSIPEDVVEEVARIHGVERIPATLPGRRTDVLRSFEPSPARRAEPAASAFRAAGFTEVVTPALVSGRLLDQLGIGARAPRVINPVTEDGDALRTSILPSLAAVVRLNRSRGRDRVAVYEMARTFHATGAVTELPLETWQLAALATAGEAAEDGRRGFLAIRAALDRAVVDLGAPAPEYRRSVHSLFHPGRCAAVSVAGRELGIAGELHPRAMALLDLGGRAVACAIALDGLLESHITRSAVELPRFPAVDRDLAVVVPAAVEAAALLASVRASGGDLLESVSAFDEYQGSQVVAGRKSIALALTFRSPERTLTDAEVDERLDAIRRLLEREQGAGFRA